MNAFKLSLCAVFISSSVFAGVETHGGGAFVCREITGEIKNEPLAIELQDLWEGRERYGLPIERKNHLTADVQVDRALSRLAVWNPSLYVLTLGAYSYVLRNTTPIAQNSVITPPQDARSQIQKRHCPLEGAAQFDELSGKIYVNSEILSKMSTTDFAALLLHESLYKALRHFGDVNSARSRHFNAFLFSELNLPNHWMNLPKAALFCKTEDQQTLFALYENQNQIHARFKSVGGFNTMDILDIPIVNQSHTTHPLELLYKKDVKNLKMGLGLVHLGQDALLDILRISSRHEQYTLSFSNQDLPGLSPVTCHTTAP